MADGKTTKPRPSWKGSATIVKRDGTLGVQTRNLSGYYGCPEWVRTALDDYARKIDPRETGEGP